MIAADLLRRLQERAEAHPEFVETLEFLASEPPDDAVDGGAEPGPELLALARRINADRQVEAEEDMLVHSLSTEDAAARLGVRSRQAVAQRRARGTLVGYALHGRMRYPEWQFTSEGVDPSLPRLLALFAENGMALAEEIDDVMRMPHRQLGGRTLAEVWRDGDWPLLSAWINDMGGWRV